MEICKFFEHFYSMLFLFCVKQFNTIKTLNFRKLESCVHICSNCSRFDHYGRIKLCPANYFISKETSNSNNWTCRCLRKLKFCMVFEVRIYKQNMLSVDCLQTCFTNLFEDLFQFQHFLGNVHLTYWWVEWTFMLASKLKITSSYFIFYMFWYVFDFNKIPFIFFLLGI